LGSGYALILFLPAAFKVKVKSFTTEARSHGGKKKGKNKKDKKRVATNTLEIFVFHLLLFVLIFPLCFSVPP
jgi:hypothetical protein